MEDRNRQVSRPGLVAGMLIVGVGVILLLDRMEMIEAGRIFRHWPLLLIVAGGGRLLDKCCGRAARAFGGIMVVAGVFLELNTLGLVAFRWDTVWPLFIIVAGLCLLWHALSDRGTAEGGDRSAARVNHWVIFGGGKLRSSTADFQGGDLFTMFGGYEIDLSHANMQREEAVLNVTTIFGGAEIRVPESWSVVTDVMPLFGGVEDKTTHPKPDAVLPPRRFVVKGTAVFGGVEIKN